MKINKWSVQSRISLEEGNPEVEVDHGDRQQASSLCVEKAKCFHFFPLLFLIEEAAWMEW